MVPAAARASVFSAFPLPEGLARQAVAEFGAVLNQQVQLDGPQIVERLKDWPGVVGLLISSRVRIDRATIMGLPAGLRIIATASVGFEHVDLIAAGERGIVVTNAPEVTTGATADLAMLLLLAVFRRLPLYGEIMRAGWRQRFGFGDFLGQDVHGKRLGIVGMGRIGQAVARRAQAFGMEVLYTGNRPAQLPTSLCARFVPSLDQLLPECDALTLHTPGGPATQRMMNARTFALMRRGAVLVNTARGSLVDEDALLDALHSGHLAGAGLDVFAREPDFDLRLQNAPNVVLVPHMGTGTVETRHAMGLRALENIAQVVAGRAPADALTPPRPAG